MPKFIDKSLEIIGNGATLERKLGEIDRVVDYVTRADKKIKTSKKSDPDKRAERVEMLKGITSGLISHDSYRVRALKCLEGGDYNGIRDIAFNCMKM